jgi:hypothetical protein
MSLDHPFSDPGLASPDAPDAPAYDPTTRCEAADHVHGTLGEARVCHRQSLRTTESGLPVHTSHRTWRDAMNLEGVYAPDQFPDETCCGCQRFINTHPDDVPDVVAGECPGYEGDDPHAW